MRRISVLTTLCFALCCAPAPALADAGGGATAAQETGGAPAGQGVLLSARGFSVAPASIAPGKRVTFAFRAAASSGRVRARVDLLAPGKPAVRAKLGLVRAGRGVSVSWSTNALAAGSYTARLVVESRGERVYERTKLAVVAPPPPPVPAVVSVTPGGLFPVQGPYSFGGEDSRFGAARNGHTHQGQDIAAAEGTPVVSPRAGTVHWVAYQATGAGHYVVINGDDGRDYVFMHLQEGSTLVAKDQPVAAGQRIASVGNTGESEGPHLHFEIWPDGWWASKASQPIDPLPQLQAWAG
jgi:murein DD-endopeptidase MepM/ murein hydrolase activator NlpD